MPLGFPKPSWGEIEATRAWRWMTFIAVPSEAANYLLLEPDHLCRP